jgi:hypothetical protein
MTSPFGSVASDDGRWYERDGKRYLSVTNVLDKSLSKPALVPWSCKLTAEQARITLDYALKHGEEPPLPIESVSKTGKVKYVKDWETDWKREHKRVKDASAERGTIIHDWAEQWELGREPDPPPEYVDECLGILRAFEKYEITPIAAECTVYNSLHKYAGTGDLFATVGAWGGVTAMLDFKTGKKAWPETAYQLAAYRFGEFIGLPDGSDVPVPVTQAGGVLHVDHGTTHLIPYRCGLREFEAFTHMVKVAYEVVEETKNVMNHAAILS